MIDFNSFRKDATKKGSSSQELKKRIVSYVRQNGPSLPVTISKALNNNTIMIGAMLSELIANKAMQISKCKIGSSPLYYVPGQEAKLTKVRDYLSERPKQMFDMLKENKVMRDSELEPWQRVAVREIRDFAKPLDVTINNETETFWKWYMVKDEEVNSLISGMLNPKEKNEEKAEEKVKEKDEERVEEKKEEKPKKEKKPKIIESPLRSRALGIFEELKVEVEEELPGKKTECTFKISFPSPIGKLRFLAIAKSKKKLNDDDVHISHSMGVHHKLPVILIAKDIGKKAEKTLNEKGIFFRKL